MKREQKLAVAMAAVTALIQDQEEQAALDQDRHSQRWRRSGRLLAIEQCQLMQRLLWEMGNGR